jgi:hypothetical protein
MYQFENPWFLGAVILLAIAALVGCWYYEGRDS